MLFPPPRLQLLYNVTTADPRGPHWTPRIAHRQRNIYNSMQQCYIALKYISVTGRKSAVRGGRTKNNLFETQLVILLFFIPAGLEA